MFRVIGPRALIDPVETPRTSWIELTDRQVPVLGRVVQIGTVSCPDCGAVSVPDVEVGALVFVPPTAGQEILVDDHAYWLVPLADLGAEWQEDIP